MTVVYDTRLDDRPVGHGAPPDRLAHAYPEGSNVALCGHAGPRRPYLGAGRRCPDCEYEAGRKHFIGR